MTSVSLPMYNFARMRPANAAFWTAVADRMRKEGYADLPYALDFGQPPVPASLAADTLLTQTCGYPLQTIYQGQFQLVATPGYTAPGCEGFEHSAFFIVREQDAARNLEDLRGRRFAVNSVHSNSGMNLPRRTLASLAKDGRFFTEVVDSGSHPNSLELVRSAKVDAASVDCLTWAFAQRYAPELVVGLRVLAPSTRSPAIPFVTGAATPPDVVQALRRALVAVGNEPEYESVRTPLFIASIQYLEWNAYDIIMRMEHEAEQLKYPEIA